MFLVWPFFMIIKLAIDNLAFWKLGLAEIERLNPIQATPSTIIGACCQGIVTTSKAKEQEDWSLGKKRLG